MDRGHRTTSDFAQVGIDIYSPFRVFLELGRETSLSPVGEFLRVAIFVVGVALLPAFKDGIQWIADIEVPWKSTLVIIGVPTTGAVAIIVFLAGARRWLLAKIRILGRLERRLERWLLRS
jgi:hypothetical protein